MRHNFSPLGGTLNTFRCTRCGVFLHPVTTKARCTWRDGVVRAFRAILALSPGFTRRKAYDEIYGH